MKKIHWIHIDNEYRAKIRISTSLNFEAVVYPQTEELDSSFVIEFNTLDSNNDCPLDSFIDRKSLRECKRIVEREIKKLAQKELKDIQRFLK